MTDGSRSGARIDAIAKVTGRVRYASDHGSARDLHGVLVQADAAKGRIVRLDTGAAEAQPGVRLVLTHHTIGTGVGVGTFLYDGGHFHSSFAPLSGPDVRFHGQMIALVVAETPEDARYAASLITWQIEREPALVGLADAGRDDDLEIYRLDVGDSVAGQPGTGGGGGDFRGARVERTYSTAEQLHQPLEPYATRAEWTGGRLIVESPSQWVVGEARGLAEVLGLDPSAVRVVSPVVGGAFGSRVLLLWHTVYVAEAARRLGRPVRLHVGRAQMATLGSFRAATRHSVLVEADTDGRVTGYCHQVRSQTSRSDVVPLPGTSLTSRIYDIPRQHHREWVVPRDLPTPGFMRAPLEYPAAFAFESAMDELALSLDIDPLDLRLRNLAAPGAGPAPATRHLARCLREGAQRFGWDRRNRSPGSMRDAVTEEVLGWGMAVAHYPGYRGGLTRCRITATPAGRFVVSLAAHDPGTGLASAVAVAVAEALGVSLHRVRVELGDSDLPLAPMAAGSASSGTAVAAALDAVDRLVHSCADVVRHPPDRELTADGTHVPEGYTESQVAAALDGNFQQSGAGTGADFRLSVGAHFVEVGVDVVAGRVRVRRMVGAFDVGAVLHPTALSGQLEAGMLWGAGHALMEDARLDGRAGRFLATGLTDYHVLVHADTPSVDVVVLGDRDPQGGRVGAKGAGELGVVGSSAAVTNAIHHATGHRVRDLPVRAEDVLG